MLAALAVRLAGQAAPLTIVSATPRGEIGELADAGQIRIVFSEPMVAVGAAPTNTVPAWLHITPRIRGTCDWSGTRTLICSPDPAAPPPFATTFTVRVEAGAASVSGRALAEPYLFSFSTPSVRLVDADWYRKGARFDSPAVIALRFNQPVRPQDVIRQIRVAMEPHEWTPPKLSARAREQIQRTNADGLRRFDEKVAAVERVAASTDPVAVRLATAWNLERFPMSPRQVVVETSAAPPPDAWLRIARGRHHTIVRLEPTFFAEVTACEFACTLDLPLLFTRPVDTEVLARALTIADITERANERLLTPERAPKAFVTSTPRPTDVGFDAQLPRHVWRLHLAADLQAADGQTLGYPWVEFVETAHAESFIALGGSVLEAAGGPEAPFFTRNVVSIHESLEAVTPPSLAIRLHDLKEQDPPPPGDDAPKRPLDVTPDVVQTHTLDLRPVLSQKGTGLVWTDISMADRLTRYSAQDGVTTLTEIVTPWAPREQRSVLQVTNLGVTLKHSAESALVFVTRLDTGDPVAGARVAIVSQDNDRIWRSTTDGDGVAFAPSLALLTNSNGRPLLELVVTAEKDGDVAFVPTSWPSEHFDDWTEHASHSDSTLLGSIFTDRGVYKPEEDVHIKAVLREDTPAGLRVPQGTEFDVVVEDARWREVDRRRVSLNRWGSAEWTWRPAAGSSLGEYQITVSRPSSVRNRDESVSGRFRVAAFRRPDFRVDATLAGDPPILGTTLRGTIEASYLFGAAMGAQPVRWWSHGKAVQQPPVAILDRYPASRYAVGYVPENDDSKPSETDASLGPDGRLAVTIPTIAQDAAVAYSLEADVEGPSHQHVANRTSLVVHPASIYVAVSRPPLFVETKTGIQAGIAAIDLSGTIVPDVTVTMSLIRYQWERIRNPASPWPGEWVRREIPAGTWTVRTTSGETALPVPVPDGGAYVLRATARDSAGRQTRTEVDFYAVGSTPTWWQTDGNTFELVPERKTWKPGESARILIKSPWPSATALLTVEREGVRTHRRFAVTSTQDVVDVPITEADVPNVYVSVLLVKGRTADSIADGTGDGAPAYRVGYTELNVDDGSKRLAVRVSADRSEYRPGDSASVAVTVTRNGGVPETGDVTLWAVDRGLLSLTGYTTPDLVRELYVPRTLHVWTVDNRASLMRGKTFETHRAIPGVAGGHVFDDLVETMSVAASALPDVDVAFGARQDFRPLVFWLGSATTDAQGRVTTAVTLPDSLTTYRIMAVVASDTRFGFGEHEVRVSKPLALLPSFPRFLNAGDRAAIGAVVTNAGPREGTAVVTIASLDRETLRFSETRRTVRLAAGASQSITFEAVARGAGAARVQMTAALDGETDALQLPISVTQPRQRQTTAAYGDTEATATEMLTVPAGTLPDAGGLTVELASTALVGLGDGARYLNEYPYGCAEQRASRAFALLLASDLGGAFTIPGVDPASYRTAAADALHELSRYQCADGGYSLWSGSCHSGSAYLTAYILHVMKTARTLNVAVDDTAVNGALDFLEQQLDEPAAGSRWWTAWAVSQSYAVKVLAEFGRDTGAAADRLLAEADRLPTVSLSHLADALAASGDAGPRYQDIVRRLTNALRVEADRAHIEERDDDDSLAWVWNTNVTSTAAALGGFARRNDNAAPAASLARWLVAAQTNGRWGSTHENATVLEALVAYYRAFEKDVPQMTVRASLGSASLGTAAFEGRSTDARQIRVSMPDLLKRVATDASPALSISRAGTGRLFYTARLDTFTPASPSASDRGFHVERRYERYAKGVAGAPGLVFAVGDLVRVTVTLTLRGEGRYLALADPLPAGFEPLENWALTTASDDAAEATQQSHDEDWLWSWRAGSFDHVEKHDDRVLAFATQLASGRHEFSYLVRATTVGTFQVPGATVEAMYAPEVTGRSAAARVSVR